MEFYELKGNKDLARDPITNSVVNVNSLDYQQYVTTRKIKSEKNQKQQTIEQELANVKSDINEIKSLLKELLHGS
jgi:hypothetical protein|tara:strand:- start:1659 stop:1883 length:225 start_codon:yes stop_codon:yes gene_type:complete